MSIVIQTVLNFNQDIEDTYKNPETSTFTKEITLRLASLGMVVVNAVTEVAFVTFCAIAYAFNLITLGYFECLREAFVASSIGNVMFLFAIFQNVISAANPHVHDYAINYETDSYASSKILEARNFLASTYADPDTASFTKYVSIRLGYLLLGGAAAVSTAAYLAIGAIAFTFNFISFGCIEPLNRFSMETLLKGSALLSQVLIIFFVVIRPDLVNAKSAESEKEIEV